MDKNNKKLKILLRGGDKKKEIFEVLEGDFLTSYNTVYLVIPDHFPLLLSQDFIDFFEDFLEKDSGVSFFFVSEKIFFQELLKRNKLPCLKSIKDLKDDVAEFKEKKIPDFFGKIKAKKNQSEEEIKKEKDEKVKSLSIKFMKKKKEDEGVEDAGFSSQKIDGEAESTLRGWGFFLFIGILVLLLLLWNWIIPTAVIEVKPVISAVEITQNMLVKLPDGQVSKKDELLPIVNGILVESVEKSTEIFPSLRNEYETTESVGEVTIFNASSKPKYFIPSRLSTKSGLVFRTQKSITVPPMKDSIPGKLIVEVIADKTDLNGKIIGNRGNIIAGTSLYFPGLRKELRESFYAKANRGPLVGGSTLTRYFVGEDDYKIVKPNFRSILANRAQNKLEEEMQKRNNREKKNYILLNHGGVIFSEILAFNTDEKLIGEELKTFTVDGEVKVSGLVFDQDQVIRVLSSKLKQKQDQRKKILQIDPNSIVYRVLGNYLVEKLDEEGQIKTPKMNFVKLSVSLKGVESFDFNQSTDDSNWVNDLKKEIAGKHKNRVRGLLANHIEIEEVLNLKITPFWRKELPEILDQIELKVNN